MFGFKNIDHSWSSSLHPRKTNVTMEKQPVEDVFPTEEFPLPR